MGENIDSKDSRRKSNGERHQFTDFIFQETGAMQGIAEAGQIIFGILLGLAVAGSIIIWIGNRAKTSRTATDSPGATRSIISGVILL